MTRHHLIITGTGRAGTTFLVQLYTALGLETGYRDTQSEIHQNSNAGMEYDLRNPHAPYIVKSPWICDYLDEIPEDGEIIIDHAIVPVRDLFSAAESRRDVTRRTESTLYPDGIPGGLWHTDEPQQQEAVLAVQLYKLIYAIARRDIPLTLLHFPRIIHDPKYLYRKIGFSCRAIDYDAFLKAFKEVVKPEFVHNFLE